MKRMKRSSFLALDRSDRPRLASSTAIDLLHPVGVDRVHAYAMPPADDIML